ncbi:amino acid ABC transporter permease [Arthrobacter sp. FW305-123]|nr:amino acid ABC transporter permease [Arthrobacter sp. FW305-123]
MNYFLDLFPGLATTFGLWLMILVIGLPAGMIFGYLMGTGKGIIRVLAVFVVNVARGFPGLVTLYFVYTGLPELQIFLSSFASVVAAFSFTTMGYTADIFRSAIQSVPRAQTEAATALGLGFWKTQGLIILPQALRTVIPALLGFTVLVLQATSLGYSVGVKELTGLSYNLGSVTFDALNYMLATGAIYLVLCVVISQLAAQMGRRRKMRPRARATAIASLSK